MEEVYALSKRCKTWGDGKRASRVTPIFPSWLTYSSMWLQLNERSPFIISPPPPYPLVRGAYGVISPKRRKSLQLLK